MPSGLVVALILTCFGAVAALAGAPAAELVGIYRWPKVMDAFYGFSGIEVSDDGTRFVMIGDGSQVISGEITRDEDGALTGVRQWTFSVLNGLDGEPIRDNSFRDAEGLAILPDGRAFVSFEWRHRVWAYDDLAGPAKTLPIPQEFSGFAGNGGLEALAATDDGTLYTLPERSGRLDAPFPVFRFDGTSWSVPFHIERKGPFLPVGADIGPDGRFYLLERNFLGIFGFQSRVRRFEITDDAFVNEVTLLETLPRTHDNLEGISVWRDPEGAIRILMVSDDNGREPLLKTEFVEYRVTE